MTDTNIVLITGRLVRDIELRSTATGSRFAWFQLAVNGRKDKDGKQQTDFIPCQLWGKPAELLEKFGKKGTRIIIDHGAMKTFVKEDPHTNTHQTYCYLAISGFQFVDGIKQQAKPASAFDSMGDGMDVEF